MRIPNREVIQILKEALAAMEIKGYNFFKIRAYQNAIAILDNLTVSIYDLWETKRLDEIPGVGEGLGTHLNELFKTGKVIEFEKLKEGLPDGMFGLLGLRGIGAKKAYKLALTFKLVDRNTAADKLKEFALKNKIQVLEGFGEKSEKDILESIEQSKKAKNSKPRMLFPVAEAVAERIIEHMKKSSFVKDIEGAGSYRRKNATVGDLDFPISTNEPEKAIERFLKFPEIKETVVQGDKKASVVLTNEVQVDIRVSTPEAYGAMLQYFTGSKQHNILLRNYALSKGLSLSEYGIKKNGKIIEFADEKDFYKYLGLPYIPPELRHGSNEIEVAIKNKLPNLIEPEDIKGDVHVHTTDSDGINTLEEVVEMAISKGYQYLGVTDHAPSITARGYGTVLKLFNDRKKHLEAINKSQNKVKVLLGYEVNILADATLGLPNEILKELDYCVASIHTAFTQDKEIMTNRILMAIENPYVNIIGHPSGRLINERDPADPNWDKVFDAARDYNKILEINSQPNRLDLTDDLVKSAKEWGIKMIINSDAHAIDQFNYMKYGIYNARRGWAEKKDIVNSLNLPEFLKAINARNQF
jgi:DNA polymerase (family 10)